MISNQILTYAADEMALIVPNHSLSAFLEPNPSKTLELLEDSKSLNAKGPNVFPSAPNFDYFACVKVQNFALQLFYQTNGQCK